MTGRRERTFLVESYVPQLDKQIAATISARVREAAREFRDQGLEIQWHGSFALLSEETYVCIVTAPDGGAVIQLNERARLENDHVVEVIAIDPYATASADSSRGPKA